jgi:hypothetical protein
VDAENISPLPEISITTVIPPNPTKSPYVVSPEDALIWCFGIRICNDGTDDLAFSFDGTNIHGVVKSAEDLSYLYRFESGIAVMAPNFVMTGAIPFRIEAW